MPRLPLCLLLLAAALTSGCGTEPPAGASAPAPSVPPVTPSAFDPTACGKITGAVTWTGALPNVAPVLIGTPRADGNGLDHRQVPLGNAPHIDPAHRGVAGAVVYLRDVNVNRAKPWDLPKVEVEFRDSQIVVKQGDRVGRTGFVRRSDSVTAQSVESVYHNLRARGAAYLALPFPDPHKPLTRALHTCGRVELTSASGSYWQAADLFVCDHPYYAATDADGGYKFTNVPEGNYDLVAWHPSWEVVRKVLNPETGVPARLVYAPPLEASRPVSVARGRTALANLTLPK